MKKINAFIDNNFKFLVLALLVLVFMRTCNNDTKVMSKRIDKLTKEVQVLKDTVVTQTDLQIEGLKSEKRMIQSTDRTMLDVQRQTDIDKEIKRLENK